jgi:putative tRNA adenosine deaminase-associated protein
VIVSYFAAVLARSEDGWVAAELDLDEVESLDDVGDAAQGALREEAPDADDELLVVLVEQQDEWFGVVRFELGEDPRVFVSDAAAALRHALGETLLPDLVVPPPDDVDVLSDVLQPGTEPTTDVDAPIPDKVLDRAVLDEAALAPELEAPHPSGPVGDVTLLDDLGVGSTELQGLARSGEGPPPEVLEHLAQRLGGAEALESVR